MNADTHKLIWLQREISLNPASRGCHLVTDEAAGALASSDFAKIRIGWANVFIKHTSASLTINENADPDVRVDMETALNQLCPESMPFIHTLEGPDDMPAHVKASLMGASLNIPITNGAFNLGTWQGIYLCEHRNQGGSRKLLVTAFGTT